MTPPLNIALENTIAAIESFLVDSLRNLPGEHNLRRLTEHIRQTQTARNSVSSGKIEELTKSLTYAYGEQLERLHLRLTELESAFVAERDRCLASEESISRARAWHELLSRTQ